MRMEPILPAQGHGASSDPEQPRANKEANGQFLSDKPNDDRLANQHEIWQRRLLPLMIGMIVSLSGFFVVTSLIQITYLQNRLKAAPLLTTKETLASMSIDKSFQSPVSHGMNFDDQLEYLRMKTMVVLEVNALQNRYHLASILIASRIWIRYLGFVTGTILAMVGAAFILGKLQETRSDLGAEGGAVKIALSTASPGLALVLLGNALMIATLATSMDLQLTDSPIYISPSDRMQINTTDSNALKPEPLHSDINSDKIQHKQPIRLDDEEIIDKMKKKAQ